MRILFITDAPDRPETELLVKITEHADVTVMTKKDSRNFHILQSTNAKILEYDIKKRFDSKAITNLKANIDNNKYDIVHAFNSRAITCAIQAGKKSKTKILGYRGVSTNNTSLQLENWFSYLHPRLDGVFCVSKAVRDSFFKGFVFRKKQLSRKLKTIYKGHDPKWYDGEPADLEPFGIPSGAPVLCCLSRDSIKKGILTLLDAFDDLPSDLNAHLLLVGSINKNKQAINRVQQCKHPERVRFSGYVNNPTAVIRASTLLVSASESGEGLPRVVIEAMCVQSPVVATDAGGTREVIESGKNGILVAQKNKEDLTKNIISILKNPEAAKRYTEAALQSIYNKFYAEDTVKNTLAWYQEILSK